MTIMTTHSSATAREEEPHVNQTTSQTNNQTTRTATIIDALKRKAQAVLNDTSIDAQSRAVIRHALETNDPWLARLIKRDDAGETLDTNGADPSRKKIEALAEIICGAGDQSAAALLVLMGTLEHSTDPKVLAHSAKHF